MRGPLYKQGYRPRFSGHQTFALRYGWLKKTFDQVAVTEKNEENKSVFTDDDATAVFGVGKNMVASMRHWANAAGIIEEPPESRIIRTTKIGKKIFGEGGHDPYMEHPTTLWIVHWLLASNPEKTTWFWAYSHLQETTFERGQIVEGLHRLVRDREWIRPAPKTVENDAACFVRTYAAQRVSDKAGLDDALESPLAELGLVRETGRDRFRFVRGPKSTLGGGAFAFALLDFWDRRSDAATLSFEAVACEPGGPGRVFLLDENDVAERLAGIEETTGGALKWSETAGLEQVVRNPEKKPAEPLSCIGADYAASAR